MVTELPQDVSVAPQDDNLYKWNCSVRAAVCSPSPFALARKADVSATLPGRQSVQGRDVPVPARDSDELPVQGPHGAPLALVLAAANSDRRCDG